MLNWNWNIYVIAKNLKIIDKVLLLLILSIFNELILRKSTYYRLFKLNNGSRVGK